MILDLYRPFLWRLSDMSVDFTRPSSRGLAQSVSHAIYAGFFLISSIDCFHFVAFACLTASDVVSLPGRFMSSYIHAITDKGARHKQNTMSEKRNWQLKVLTVTNFRSK